MPGDSLLPTATERETQSIPGVGAPSRWQTLRHYVSAAVLPMVVTRFMLVLVGIITVDYILPLINPNQPIYPDPSIKHLHIMLYLMWQHFDSGFYISIASGGYWAAPTLKGMSNWAFFPLYPLLMFIFAFVIGTSHAGAYSIAGLLVSFMATLVAGIYLFRITKLEYSEQVANRAVWLLAVFPMSFYLTAIYPESLALALSITCLYYARRRAWWRAGICGGLAAITHPQGVLLIAPVGYELWQTLAEQVAPLEQAKNWQASIKKWCHSRFVAVWRAFRRWQTWAALAALCLIPLGLGLFCLYGYIKVHTFTPFALTEQNGWGRHFINPLQLIQQMIQHPRPASPYDWNFYGLNLVMLFFGLFMLIPIFKRLPFAYGLYTLLNVLLPVTAGETNSVARFTLGLFPIYMALALWCSRGTWVRQERRYSLLLVVFSLLLPLFMAMFTLGIYSLS